jgi:hypothetical protein
MSLEHSNNKYQRKEKGDEKHPLLLNRVVIKNHHL